MLKERVAYLNGLADGLKIGESSEDNSRVICKIIECLNQMAEQIDFNTEAITEVEDAIDDIYDAMDIYDDIIFDEDDEDDDDDEDEDDFDDEDLEFFICPSCGAVVALDEEALQNEKNPICTKCNTPLLSADED